MGYEQDFWKTYNAAMNGPLDPLDQLGGRGGKDHGEGKMERIDSELAVSATTDGSDVMQAHQAAADALHADPNPEAYHGSTAAQQIAEMALHLLAES